MTQTLPYSAYSDPGFLERELSDLIGRSWQYVANLSDLPSTGSYHPVDVNGLPIVITRTASDELHALVNVCAHRGTVVCPESGTSDSLRCPYHAWRYELDGTLRTAPRSEREPEFDPTAHALESLPLGLWGPFVFVALTTDVISFEEWMADLPDLVKQAGIDVDEIVFHSRATMKLRANWKVCIENFLECYHCRVAHPGFAKAIDTSPEGYHLLTAPTYSTQYGPVRGNWTGPFDPTGPVERGQFHLIFPNTVINIMPGHPNLSIGPITPMGVGTTHRFLDYFFGAEVTPDWVKAMLDFDDQVGTEDTALVESMQIGLQARPERTGTLFMDSEVLIAHFEDHVRSTLHL